MIIEDDSIQINIYKSTWFSGTPFQWNNKRFNGGDTYSCYRFGPLLIHIRTKPRQYEWKP